ncbi:hypothetical protein [Shewanella algae]|uniref:hypothetical protein n=1 Tax=Shewanella algae TaxID=38313 RepID=UPI00313B7DFD
MCIELKTNAVMEHSINYAFKHQVIVDSVNNVIGTEVLIDFQRTDYDLDIMERFLFSHSASACIDTIGQCLSVFPKYVFMNIERDVLCDKGVVEKICNLSTLIFEQGKHLVIEVTERNACGNCTKNQTGLQLLRENNVLIAVDDYDYLNGDFREQELRNSFYQFVKVEAPLDLYELAKLSLFAKDKVVRNLSLIIERVPTMDFFHWIKRSVNEVGVDVFGFQGFAFCRGQVIDLDLAIGGRI